MKQAGKFIIEVKGTQHITLNHLEFKKIVHLIHVSDTWKSGEKSLKHDWL
jgi:hypothetical protein